LGDSVGIENIEFYLLSCISKGKIYHFLCFFFLFFFFFFVGWGGGGGGGGGERILGGGGEGHCGCTSVET
jgi:hypothetical protein